MNKLDWIIVCLLIALISALSLFLVIVVAPDPPQASEYNYTHITNGMDIAQVTEIIGEGEIFCYDNHGMLVMKYTGEGIEMQLIFIDGIVYQKTLTLSEIEQ